jgi:hypothetical protein
VSIDDFDRPQERPDAEVEMQLPAALELDVQEYLGDLADLEITEEQKIELLKNLWPFMQAWVNAGFEGDVCAFVFGQEVEDE